MTPKHGPTPSACVKTPLRTPKPFVCTVLGGIVWFAIAPPLFTGVTAMDSVRSAERSAEAPPSIQSGAVVLTTRVEGTEPVEVTFCQVACVALVATSRYPAAGTGEAATSIPAAPAVFHRAVAGPVKRLPVMAPAAKLPEPSRATIAEAVFALAAVVAEFETLSAVEMVGSWVSAANVRFATAVVEVTVSGAVPVATFEVKLDPVMIPAAKLPEPFRSTIVDAVFAEVAVVAESSTLPAVEMTGSCVSAFSVRFVTGVVLAMTSGAVPVTRVEVICPAKEGDPARKFPEASRLTI